MSQLKQLNDLYFIVKFMDQRQPFLICLHVEWIKITINFYTHFKMATIKN